MPSRIAACQECLSPLTADWVAGMIRYRCPKCGELLESPSSLAGREDECLSCNAKVLVPGLADDASAKTIDGLPIRPFSSPKVSRSPRSKQMLWGIALISMGLGMALLTSTLCLGIGGLPMLVCGFVLLWLGSRQLFFSTVLIVVSAVFVAAVVIAFGIGHNPVRALVKAIYKRDWLTKVLLIISCCVYYGVLCVGVARAARARFSEAHRQGWIRGCLSVAQFMIMEAFCLCASLVVVLSIFACLAGIERLPDAANEWASDIHEREVGPGLPRPTFVVVWAAYLGRLILPVPVTILAVASLAIPASVGLVAFDGTGPLGRTRPGG